jgi:GT2 family glycosyltransferase
MLIFENTPYRKDKNLIKAYNSFMEIIPHGGWALFRDGDTLFLDPFYGEIIENAIHNNPDTGCFTCLTNRIGNKKQLHSEYSGDDIKIHRNIAKKLRNKNKGKYEEMPFRLGNNPQTLSGMLFVLSKDAWKQIGGFKQSTIHKNKSNILGVDNQLHKDLHENNIKIKIIKELYIYHWYRGGGSKDIGHLK